MVFGLPSICVATYPEFVSAASCHIVSSSRLAAISFMIIAPALKAALATLGFCVSMEIAALVWPASFSITGTTRFNSSSSLTGFAPGRVDSPPISNMAAP